MWLLIAALAAMAAVLYGLYLRHEQAIAASEVRKAAQYTAPNVVAARATKGSIGVYVSGLGTVIPFYTVSVSSRVDGQLMQVLYHEGQMVHRGDLLAVVDPRPYQVLLAQYQGMLLRDQALLDNARVDLDRYRVLLTRNAVPEQTYATQSSLVKQYEGNVKSDQGQIESAKLNLTYCNVTAPITGRVGLRLVDPGNLVTANSTTLVVITQVSPITVVFTISEDQLPAVRQKFNRGTRLQVDAFDRMEKDKLGRGRLETIDNEIDPTTGTVRLRATFPNANGELFPDQFVNARLLLEEKRNVTLVPNAAIQLNGAQTYVWMVQPDGIVVNHPVKLGTSGPAETQIVSGVSPGDVLVTEGVDEIHEDSRVNAEIAGSPVDGL
ncbi:MAG TPA: efflux RND transporter periplasmic adaptor subunit [Bryobacteraceae bacterium]|nr:efflux RND transporter periplasmic adaptor subunit [Bryobacteraceae bacterium]